MGGAVDPIGIVGLLKDAGPYAVTAIVLFWLWTMRKDLDAKNTELAECRKVIAELQNKRVEETQEQTRTVTQALIQSTNVQEGNAEIFKALSHRLGS